MSRVHITFHVHGCLSAGGPAGLSSQEPGHDNMTPLEGLLGSGRGTFMQDCVTLWGRWPRQDLNAHSGRSELAGSLIEKQRLDTGWAG